MVLKDYKIEGDYITISKKELEDLVLHYHSVAEQEVRKRHNLRCAFYTGKVSLCTDILKMFDTLEG